MKDLNHLLSFELEPEMTMHRHLLTSLKSKNRLFSILKIQSDSISDSPPVRAFNDISFKLILSLQDDLEAALLLSQNLISYLLKILNDATKMIFKNKEREANRSSLIQIKKKSIDTFSPTSEKSFTIFTQPSNDSGLTSTFNERGDFIDEVKQLKFDFDLKKHHVKILEQELKNRDMSLFDQNRLINQLMHKVSNLQLSKTRSKLPKIFRNQSVASITTAQLFNDANNITKEIFDFESPPQASSTPIKTTKQNLKENSSMPDLKMMEMINLTKKPLRNLQNAEPYQRLSDLATIPETESGKEKLSRLKTPSPPKKNILIGNVGTPGTDDLDQVVNELNSRKTQIYDLYKTRIKDIGMKKSSTWDVGIDSSQFIRPNQMRLVKPVKGSVTLSKWQYKSHEPCLETGTEPVNYGSAYNNSCHVITRLDT